MIVRMIFSGAALLALTACGGGGGAAGVLSSGPGSFGDLVGETNRLTNLVTGPGSTYVEVAPSEGSSTANFDGIVLMNTPGDTNPGDTAWVGQIDVTANFSGNTLSGTANNFYQNQIASNGLPGSPAESRTGTVTLSADITNSDFDVTLGGSLDLDGVGGEGGVSGTLEGNFFGPNSTTIDAFAAQGNGTADGTALEWSMVAD